MKEDNALSPLGVLLYQTMTMCLLSPPDQTGDVGRGVNESGRNKKDR
jgi:hypothetical protein